MRSQGKAAVAAVLPVSSLFQKVQLTKALAKTRAWTIMLAIRTFCYLVDHVLQANTPMTERQHVCSVLQVSIQIPRKLLLAVNALKEALQKGSLHAY